MNNLSNLSLAIGREGQNVRLAHRLTGWKIDIKSISQMENEESARIYGDRIISLQDGYVIGDTNPNTYQEEKQTLPQVWLQTAT